MDKTGNDIIVVKLVFEMKDIKAVFQRKLACTRGHYIDMTYHSVATTKINNLFGLNKVHTLLPSHIVKELSGKHHGHFIMLIGGQVTYFNMCGHGE